MHLLWDGAVQFLEKAVVDVLKHEMQFLLTSEDFQEINQIWVLQSLQKVETLINANHILEGEEIAALLNRHTLSYCCRIFEEKTRVRGKCVNVLLLASFS